MPNLKSDITFTYRHEVLGNLLPDGILSGTCPYCGKENRVAFQRKLGREGTPCIHLHELTASSDNKPKLIFVPYETGIFGHRDIQNILNNMYDRTQARKLIDRLNGTDISQAIATEWEVSIFGWLSKIGNITYEQPNSKGKKPDITLDNNTNEIHITADITTVSDYNLKKSYPIDEFISQAHKICYKLFKGEYALDITFESSTRRNLTMFPAARLQKNIEVLEEKITEIKNSSSVPEEKISLQVEENSVSLQFRKGKPFFSASYPARYYEPNKKSDPATNALYNKAGDQLLRINDRLNGIFLCDGGCTILAKNKTMNEKRLEDILKVFFTDNTNVDFVITIALYPDKKNNPSIAVHYYLNGQTNCSNQTILDNIISTKDLFIKAQQWPRNARSRLEYAIEKAERLFYV